jgi:hypothetical protein
MSTLSTIGCKSRQALKSTGRTIANRPYSTAGILLAAGVVVTVIMMWPELQRYIKMERM